MKLIAISLAVVTLTVFGCASDPKKDTAVPKTSLGTASAGDLTVELLTDTRLETGMTPIYVKVTTAAGALVTDAAVVFTPMMSMGMTSHSAPVIGPPALDADGLYRCDVVFQMAGSWSATVDVTPPASAKVTVSFPTLTVIDTGLAKPFTDTATSTKYVMSLNFRAAPVVGLNPIVVTLHRMQDMMTFPPVDDAAIHLDPQMTSMGHGSTGTVDPTWVSSGVYEGQLSFSMAGEWVTTATVSRSSVEITDPLNRPKFTVVF